MDSNNAPVRRSFIAKYITQDDQSLQSTSSSSKSDHLRQNTPSTSLSSVVSRVQNKSSWNNVRDEKDNYSSYNSTADDRREHHRHYSHHHSKGSSYSHPPSSSSFSSATNHHRQPSSPSSNLNEGKHPSRKSRDRSRSRSRSRSRDRDRYRSGSGSDDYYKSHRSDSRDRSDGNSRSSHGKSDRSYYNEGRNKSRYAQDEDNCYSQQQQQSSGSSYNHHSSRGSKSYSSATNEDGYNYNNEMEEGEIDQDDDTSNSANESSYSYHSSRDHSSREVQKFDWTCYKCGVNNFKRRNQCFKCGTDREESEANDTGDEISPTPTNCLILRNLSLTITGDQVLSFIGSLTNVPIKSIRLPRDPVYHSPRGVCYLELHTTHEATQLMSLISSIDTNALTDRLPSSPLLVSYVKRTSPSVISPAIATHAASLALAAAQWTNQQHQLPPESPQLGTVNINGSMFQKYPSPDPSKFVLEEKSGFYYDHTTRLYYDSKSKYYYNSLTQQYLLWSPKYETYLPVDSKTGSTTVGATISASATTTSSSSHNATSDPEVTNSSEQTTTNTTTCTTTSTSTTTASSSQQDNLSSNTSTECEGGKGPTDKKAEKVKTAKSIAKQMEKWAKTLNARSSAASASIKPMVPSFMKDLKAAQAAAEEEQNDDLQSDSPETRVTSFKMSLSTLPAASAVTANQFSSNLPNQLTGTVNTERLISPSIANILDDGDDSDANEVTTDPMLILKDEEKKFLDFTKLLCRLCKRQFNSREQLTKHQTVSELHANNLKTHLKCILTDYQFKEFEKKQKLDKLITPSSSSSHTSGPGTSSKNCSNEYVDRAKERRRKWGIDVDSEPNRMKEKYFDEIAAETAKAAAIASTRETKPIDSSNLGSRMLKAMGWKEGQGLGKKGTGRTDIIHVEVRNETSGLGMKKPKTTPVIPGESYKDAVKRAMAQRYKELTEQEEDQA